MRNKIFKINTNIYKDICKYRHTRIEVLYLYACKLM